MFKIPKKIKVGAYTYKVVIRKNIEHKGKKLNGFCENDVFTISIDKDLSGVEQEIVFLHECLHALDYCYSIHLGEKRIENLDHALVAFIKDNKLDL